jgi:hypothetical protein
MTAAGAVVGVMEPPSADLRGRRMQLRFRRANIRTPLNQLRRNSQG